MNDAAHPDRELTLRQAFEKYYVPHLEERRSPRTHVEYTHCVSRWEKHSDNPPVGEIDDDRLKAFQSSCIEAGLRPETINTTWTHIRTILRRLSPPVTGNPLGQAVIDRVPHVYALPIRRKIPRFVKSDELNRLYRACESADWPRTIIPPADWWRTLLVVIYNCGPRYSDLMALSQDNFDLHEKILEFKAQKTGKQHVIPLNRVTLAHLERIWSPREKLLPVGSWYKKIRTEWHELQDLAGIEKHFTFHDLRRTCATVYCKVRADLGGTILGHSLNSVTQVSYLNPVELLREPAEQLEQPSEFLEILKHPERQRSVVMEYLLNRERIRWTFQKNSATYGSQEFRLYPRRLAVLKALVTSGRPMSFADLKTVVWWDNPRVSRTVIKTTVCELRTDLARALRLPQGWNPIPFQDDGWFLDLPIDWIP